MPRKKDTPTRAASSGHRGVSKNKMATLEKLKPYFQGGLTINRACAGFNSQNHGRDYIARSTIQSWHEKDPEVRQIIDAWKDIPNVLARQTWVKQIQAGNYQAAKEWLERREPKEFSTRLELTGAGGVPLGVQLSPEEQAVLDAVLADNLADDGE